MERLSNESPSDNSDENVINNETRHGSRVGLFARGPYERNISRNESYGFLSSSDSLIVDEILNDPISSNEDLDSTEDGSTQSLIEMLDHIHRINLLSRAIEEERIRQREIERELEREAERERYREIFMNEQHELSNFVNLLNTMMFLLSAERQLRRPFIGSFRRTSIPTTNRTPEGENNEGENVNVEENGTSERDRIPSVQQPDIRYVRPNPHPIITTPFMYARFEPERPGANVNGDTEGSSESIDRLNHNNGREGPVYTRPGNVMFFNVPLSFDLTNLIQLLSASTPHSRPGASKEAIETGTRILTPEMLKFGTRLQSQPNCIICQEDFIKNINKRLKLKSKLHLNSNSILTKVDPENDNTKEKKEMKIKSDEGENNTINDNNEEKEINTDDDNIRLMPCGHIYHESCIFQWLKDNNTCPVCRYELETDDEDFNKGVYKRMGERGIDIPTFNIDFTFFCALEKCGQCKVISNLHKRRLENHGFTKCNSIENLVSHAITNVNATSMRYTRLPCCNHEFHWPCLKEALLKAGYHWEDEEADHKDDLFIPRSKNFHIQKPLVNKTPNGN